MAGDFHLLLKDKGGTFMAGFLGSEHLLTAKDCGTQESPYEIETPLDTNSGGSIYDEITLPCTTLKDILNDVRIHSDVIRISMKSSKATFDSSFESPGFVKELVNNQQSIKVRFNAGIHACFEIDDILPMLSAKLALPELVTLRLSKAAMIMELLDQQGFKVQYFVAPCKVEEATTRKAKQVTTLADVKQRIDELERKMGIHST
jgi:hypothetical protein